jgi:hypothetical protein
MKNKTQPIKTVSTFAFIVPIYDVSYNVKKKDFLVVPVKPNGNQIGYQVVGYDYMTGNGWKIIDDVELYATAKKIACDHHERAAKYWGMIP